MTYTLVLVMIAWSHSADVSDNAIATSFKVPSTGSCQQTAKLLAAQTNEDIAIKAYCVPRGSSGQ